MRESTCKALGILPVVVLSSILVGDKKENHSMWTFYSIFVWIVVLASIEQTIQRNNQGAAMSEWSFGQTLAVSVTLSSIVQARLKWKQHWPLIKAAQGIRDKGESVWRGCARPLK